MSNAGSGTTRGKVKRRVHCIKLFADTSRGPDSRVTRVLSKEMDLFGYSWTGSWRQPAQGFPIFKEGSGGSSSSGVKFPTASLKAVPRVPLPLAQIKKRSDSLIGYIREILGTPGSVANQSLKTANAFAAAAEWWRKELDEERAWQIETGQFMPQIVGDIPCEVCATVAGMPDFDKKNSTPDNPIIVCDTCQKGWHNGCLENKLLESRHDQLPDIWRCGECVTAWEKWGATQTKKPYFGIFRMPPPDAAPPAPGRVSAPGRSAPGPLLSFEAPAVREIHPLVLKVLAALDSQQVAEAFVREAPIELDADTEPRYKTLRGMVERLLKLESGLKKPPPTETTKRLYLASEKADAPPFNYNPLEDLCLGALVILGPYDTPRRFLLGSVTAITQAATAGDEAKLTFDLMLPKDTVNGNADVEFPYKWEYGAFKLFEQAIAGVRGKVSLTVPQAVVLWAGQLSAQGKIYAKDQNVVQHILGSLKAWTGDRRQLLALPAEFDDV